MKYERYTDGSNHTLINLFEKTFTKSEGEAEGKLISKLVTEMVETTNPKDIVIFVAKDLNQIVGSVIFSRFWFESSHANAFILSPAAVLPSYQGQGTGQQLIEYAHEYLFNDGVELTLTYGDINFYGKCGYLKITEKSIQAPQPLSYPQGWLAKSLVNQPIPTVIGKTKCSDALDNPVYW